jgi:hypothetical protein
MGLLVFSQMVSFPKKRIVYVVLVEGSKSMLMIEDKGIDSGSAVGIFWFFFSVY